MHDWCVSECAERDSKWVRCSEGDDLGNLSCFSSRLYSLSWVRVGGVVGGETTQKQ